MKKILISILILCSTLPAFAWGDREQGALAGLVTGLVLREQISRPVPQPTYTVYQQPICGYNVYCAPPVVIQPPVCQTEYVYDRYGQIIGTRNFCR